MKGTEVCAEKSADGFLCTLPLSHQGRHQHWAYGALWDEWGFRMPNFRCTDVMRDAADYYEHAREKAEGMATGKQIGGDHYRKFAIQPAEFVIKNKITGAEAQIIGYVCRHRDKNGAEDLKKARHWIDLLLEIEYGEEAA